MSWASRRRASYAFGIILFFAVIIVVPLAYHVLTIKPTCFDGIQDGGETAPDMGGPCARLDPRALSPLQLLWSRSFRVRDGSYSAIAYVQNANQGAGVEEIHYRFGLYDDQNILIAEQTGESFIMPGGITPIFEPNIATGQRIATHTFFEFTEDPAWQRLSDVSHVVKVGNSTIADVATAPRITATAQNTSVVDLNDVRFAVIVYDPQGNAFAASETSLTSLAAGASATITFTWPQAFNVSVGKVQIIPLVAPIPANPGSAS